MGLMSSLCRLINDRFNKLNIIAYMNIWFLCPRRISKTSLYITLGRCASYIGVLVKGKLMLLLFRMWFKGKLVFFLNRMWFQHWKSRLKFKGLKMKNLYIRFSLIRLRKQLISLHIMRGYMPKTIIHVCLGW